MTKLIWHERGSRLYEAGVDRGVIFPQNGSGIVWNGLISVNENSSDDSVVRHYDTIKYHQKKQPDSFSARVEAFTYPDGFGEEVFGMSYRTLVGDEREALRRGYKIHLVYNATAVLSDIDYSTVDNSIEPTVFSWDITTVPIPIQGAKASAHLIIDSKIAHPWALEEFENLLYGTDETESILPTPAEVLELFESNSLLRIIDHGDGTWTAIGPDDAIQMLDSTTFEITWPSAVYIDSETYKISSL